MKNNKTRTEHVKTCCDMSVGSHVAYAPEENVNENRKWKVQEER